MAEPRRALRGRFIRKQICDSKSVAELIKKRGPWAGLLFERMILWGDDDGRLVAEPRVIKAHCIPWHDRSVRQVQADLEEMHRLGLIILYQADGTQYAAFPGWHQHQPKQREERYIPSEFPAPPGLDDVDAPRAMPHRYETSLAEAVAAALSTGEWRVGGLSIISVEREVRIGNSYLDLVATAETGERVVFELKRWRLSHKGVRQLCRYIEALKETLPGVPVHGVLLGYGLARGFDLTAAASAGISVLIYDEDGRCHEAVRGTLSPLECSQLPVISPRNNSDVTGKSRIQMAKRCQCLEEEDEVKVEEEVEGKGSSMSAASRRRGSGRQTDAQCPWCAKPTSNPLQWYHDEAKRVLGRCLVIDGSVCGPLIAKRERELSRERCHELFAAYLASQDPFVLERGHSLKLFCSSSMLDGLAAALDGGYTHGTRQRGGHGRQPPASAAAFTQTGRVAL